MALKLAAPDAEIVVADGDDVQGALSRTRILGIGAHPDDLELMSWHAIASGGPHKSYSGVVVADGADSPRVDGDAAADREDMQRTRRDEQRRAARIGGYAACVLLGYPSAAIKHGCNADVVADLATVLAATRPDAVFTHSPCDFHDTHVAVAMHVIAAARSLPIDVRPRALYGCEVWGGLDWLAAPERVAFDVSEAVELGERLVAVFASQLRGKRYDQAALGRRRANAVFLEPRAADRHAATELALDLSSLLGEPAPDVHAFVMELVNRTRDAISTRIRRFDVGGVG
ncbi:MAG: PIG-L family deacetylase [Deltaproteobacteria bacterium]|nr:PIG-L family deacetylase [Deltaproteobacteria bacterium]